jgi:hypothetical protein
MMALLKRYGVTATFTAAALSLERAPELAANRRGRPRSGPRLGEISSFALTEAYLAYIVAQDATAPAAPS